MSRLKNGRLIPKGEPCPFASICKFAADKTCNRPGVMQADFSCGLARGFDVVEQNRSLLEHVVTCDSQMMPAVSKKKLDLEEEVFDKKATRQPKGRKPKKR